MHLSHFIRKWITAILNQISLAMLTAFFFPLSFFFPPSPFPAQSTSLDMVKITPARNRFNLDALAMYFLEVFT